ncbi:PAS domain-containing protein [Rhizobium sp. Leaf383]|uniref:PAS domain-containing protein n=1 Tax=Rhizobium sp. Leaf383 TaxID=1736357 RepID=UPI000714A5D3|nr:PAS domain-containing protein [Rhizobium sp. Leaf383]KQS76410.1 hypothetical protein ASG58_11335 [Rhizobium sp. Leaf383]
MSSPGQRERLRKRLRRLVDALPGYGWAASADGRCIYESPTLRNFVETDTIYDGEGTHVDVGWHARVLPQDREKIAADWRAAVTASTGCELEHQVRCRDGTFRWVKSSAKPVRDRAGILVYWLGTVVDIDGPVRNAEHARLNEAQLRTLLDTIPAPIWSADAHGRPLYSNKAHLEQTGHGIDQLRDPECDPLRKSMTVLVHPNDRGIEEGVKRAFRDGTPINVKYRKRQPDGTFRWVNNKAQAYRDESGNIIAWYGVSMDVDDEVNLQKHLSDRENELRRVVDTLPAIIWTTDAAGRSVYLNQRFKAWTGCSVADPVHDDEHPSGILEPLVHPDDRPAMLDAIRESFASGRAWTARFRLARTDGSYRWTEGRMAPLRADEGQILHWYGLAVDIDDEVNTKAELKLSQERLDRAARIAGMAEISATIAHEISQPLGAVVAGVDASRRWLDTAPPNIERARSSLLRTAANARTASDVIERIRNLFRTASPHRGRQDINAIVRSTLNIAAETAATHNVKVTTSLAGDLPHLQVDAVEIQQIILNLVRNAAEAMRLSGQQNMNIWLRTEEADGGTIISVEDNGPGLSDTELVFEPFFTTKKDGMGIGLAVCRSIAASYGGRLSAENTQQGAKLTLRLPHNVPIGGVSP